MRQGIVVDALTVVERANSRAAIGVKSIAEFADGIRLTATIELLSTVDRRRIEPLEVPKNHDE